MLTVVQQCREDFTTESNRRQKAELSQELLVLLVYTAITPGRCKEYTTLEFEVHEDSLPPMNANPRAPNCIHITGRGDAAHMVLADHKTSQHHGCDRVVLSGDSPLLSHLARHIQGYRHILTGAEHHKHLFVVSADEESYACG